MARTLPLVMPVPRTVVGIKRRVRTPEPERLCVLDDVPLLVRAPDPDEAPVCARHEFTQYRSFEGALYRPLYSTWHGGSRPETAAAVVRARAFNEVGNENNVHEWRDKGERLVDVRGAFRKAKRDRGLRTVEAHQLREIHDDGLADQRRRADAMAANLILVDGELWHRCPGPLLGVGVTGRLLDTRNDTCRISAGAWDSYLHDITHDRHSLDAEPIVTDGPWMTFGPAESGKLAEFAEALAGEPWHGRGRLDLGGLGKLQVLDHDALASALPARGPSEVLAESTAFLLKVTAEHIPDLPDAGVHAYLAAREAVAALGRGLDPDEAYARIRPYAEAIDALCAPVIERWDGGEDDWDGRRLIAYDRMVDLTHACRALRLRYERFESPRPDLWASPEMESLAALAR